MRRAADVVDKAEAWDAACASFEKGRHAGLREAAAIAEEQAKMWAEHATNTEDRRHRYAHQRASGAVGCVAAIIRAALAKSRGEQG